MERKIFQFGRYFDQFLNKLPEKDRQKIDYVLSALKSVDRISSKVVKHLTDGLYEIRIDCGNNIYRIFFMFDKENIIILFNGFKKKSQKTPHSELEKAIRIKKEYLSWKKKQC